MYVYQSIYLSIYPADRRSSARTATQEVGQAATAPRLALVQYSIVQYSTVE